MTPNQPPAWILIERAVEAFESARAQDRLADPSRFCPENRDPNRLPILRELLRIDLEYAWNEGCSRRIETYRDRFPEVFADPESLRQIAFEEYRLRRARGEEVTPDEYASRYRIEVENWMPIEERTVGNPTEVFGHRRPPVVAEEHIRFPEAGEEFLDFHLLRELGRGAFARVYLAVQRELADRPVALKISKKLEEESQTLARLQHTNIVPIYSRHRHGPFHAVCMPYFGATTLEDAIRTMKRSASLPGTGEGFVSSVKQRKASTIVPSDPMGVEQQIVPFPEIDARSLNALARLSYTDATLRLAIEIADGLIHAHDRGVIHRDLKPANILIADDGRPMLLDFNLAAVANSTPGSEPSGGTPFYMAPEHLDRLMGSRNEIDGRVDLYAFGLILFELLTGRPPVPPPNLPFAERIAKLRSARSVPPPSLRAINPTITPSLEAIVRKCLEPNRENRYASPHQLREDLHRQLNDLPLRYTVEPSRKERWSKFARRNRWVKSLPFVAGVFLVAILLTGIAVHYGIEQARHATAETTFRDHQRDFGVLRPTLTLPDPDPSRIEKTREAVRVALDRYRVVENPDWQNAVAVRYLGHAERERLRTDLTELLLLASSWEVKDDASRSVEMARRARDLAPTEGLRWQAGEELARRFDQQGDPKVAQSAREANGPPPPSTSWKYRVAEAHAERQFALAREILEGVESASRREPDFWYAWGRTHASLGDHVRAVDAFDTAMALQIEDPHLVLAHRGQSYYALKEYAKARTDFEELIRQRPDDGRNYLDRALVRLAMKDAAAAIEDLDSAERLLPGHTRILFVRERAYLLKGDRKAASDSRQKGLEAEPGDTVSWVARGVAKLAKDPRGALADFDSALKLEPKDCDALQNKAAVLADSLDRVEEAVRVLDTLIKIDPDHVAARAGRAVYLARLGKRDSAHADAIAVLKRNSRPFYRYQLAGVYALTSKTHPDDAKQGLALLASALRENIGLEYVGTDPDIRPLERLPQFKRLLDAARILSESGQSQR